MALMDLKVRVIPDMKQFNRDIQKGVTGVGGKGGGSKKNPEVQVTGFGKMLASLAGIGLILKSLDFLISPILRLFDIILKSFFVPLLPIVTSIIKFFAKVLRKTADTPQLTIGPEAGILETIFKSVFNVGAKIGDFFFKLGGEIGQALWDKVILPIGNFISKWIIKIGTFISDAILKGWDLIVQGFNFIKDGLKSIIDGIVSFVNSIIPGRRFDIGGGRSSRNVTINTPMSINLNGNMSNVPDSYRAADTISNALARTLSRSLGPSIR